MAKAAFLSLVLRSLLGHLRHLHFVLAILFALLRLKGQVSLLSRDLLSASHFACDGIVASGYGIVLSTEVHGH